MKEWKKWIRPT